MNCEFVVILSATTFRQGIALAAVKDAQENNPEATTERELTRFCCFAMIFAFQACCQVEIELARAAPTRSFRARLENL